MSDHQHVSQPKSRDGTPLQYVVSYPEMEQQSIELSNNIQYGERVEKEGYLRREPTTSEDRLGSGKSGMEYTR